MREVTFLRQHAEKWKRFEKLLKKGNRVSDPDELATLYIELNNDLAFAQSQYPDTKTAEYLNGLLLWAHSKIYRNKKEPLKRIVHFWAVEIPTLFSFKMKELLASVIVFLVFVGIGSLSQLNDPSFARTILGDAYVNFTLENIDSGDPLAIYKSRSEMSMFVGITFNNVMVSFRNFIMGLFSVFGTGYIMLLNGIMVGSFITFFTEFDLLFDAFLVIFIHGALELSAITISGAAGFVLGNSFLFPGSFTRGQSLAKGAKEGIKMIVGLVPVFVLAGFLEGFVTRYTNMPMWLSLTIICSSFLFILFYFFILPITIKRQRTAIL
ncbi:MAG: stage II sporulation protein M [Bacteroidota bacterium]